MEDRITDPNNYPNHTAPRRSLSLSTSQPINMEAPADQTMKEEVVEVKQLNENDYEVGLCQKCDKPCVILGLLVCPCSVYGHARARQFDKQPLKYGCYDCICSPIENPTMDTPLNDCIGCCLAYGWGYVLGPPLASCLLRKQLRRQYNFDLSFKTQAKDCATYTFLPWCAIYQDYSELKLREDKINGW